LLVSEALHPNHSTAPWFPAWDIAANHGEAIGK
jgi:hypothetical protein